ncbi:RDD family protein [Halalkalibacterium halodurans]|uniref:RDD family protein n=1 Tax=Halalkalibacterium halodurans TaxID=86665 RepID=UPI002AAA44C8|nr:RDD family protein [Halalkalibacterium halodurans]MDY7223889.1 RDD family protein [Halalkalibacterium halodurans]MDY7243110.1 RDD family protein [Halalkalibacterium halodurans]
MVSNPAGFWIRLGAGLLDGIIIGIPLAIITLILGLEEPMTSIFQGGVNLVYGLLLPVLWLGYTIGKKICGVRIVKLDGENVGIGTMLLRTIVAGFVYLITFGIAVIVSAFMVGLREDKRSLHDLIAGTYVTYDAPGQTPEAE